MSETEKVDKITDAKKPRSERFKWLKSPYTKGAAIGTAATAALFVVAGASHKKGFDAGFGAHDLADPTDYPVITSSEE